MWRIITELLFGGQGLGLCDLRFVWVAEANCTGLVGERSCIVGTALLEGLFYSKVMLPVPALRSSSIQAVMHSCMHSA